MALLSCALLVAGAVPSFGGALIYYNGTGTGTTVTNFGSLGELGNGTIQTAGTGSVSFVNAGGPQGVEDTFFRLQNSSSNGARISVPVENLPSLTNHSWSISGWFNRESTTTTDTILHFGMGDNFGTEEELSLFANQNSNTVSLQNYNPSDLNLGTQMPAGTWHFYAITFAASGLNDGRGTMTLYLGDRAPLTNSSFTLEFSSILNLGGIGYTPNNASADRDFLGGLDEFAFYDEVLDSAQVAGLRDGTLTPTTVPEPRSAVMLLAGFGLLRPFSRFRRG